MSYVTAGNPATESGYVSLTLSLAMTADEVRRLAAFLRADGWDSVADEMLEELAELA